jgi:RHS repeat-associated protein
MTTKNLIRAACAWGLLCSVVALGQVNKAGPDLGWTDAQNNGAFTESIPIEVPAFHGIEPHLSVNYNSDSSFGLMGVGWSLSGFSIIERANFGRGAPSYNGLATVTSDIFLLDGHDVTSCQTGNHSPSCSSGGNMATVVESYNKIFYNTSNDTWTITDREGTVYTYSPIYQRPCSTCAGNFGGNVTWRYGISSVTNLFGDTVTYTWVQNKFSPQWTGPASVTYNGNTINLNYLQVATNSPIRYADGIGLTSIYGVIQSIDVQVGGSRARAYQFNYTTSAATQQLVLTKAQEFGKDAVINSSGAVTSGTALPAITMGYSENQPTFAAQSGYTQFAAYNTNDIFLGGDVNGDGLQDLVALTVNGTRWTRQIWWGTSSGTFSAGPIDSLMDYGSSSAHGQYFMADLNGDGKADLLEMCTGTTRCGSNWTRHEWLSNGAAFTSGPQDTAMANSAGGFFLVQDLDGDGKADVLEMYAGSTQWGRHVWINSGNGFNSGTSDNLTRYTTTPAYYLPADIDGDGKWDMIEIHIDANNTNWDMQTWLSTGNGFVIGYATVDKGMTYNVNSQFIVEDFNGDGKMDFVELRPTGSWWTRTPHASKGYTFTALAADTAMSYQSTAVEHYFTGDFNGDGRADMLEMSDYQMLNQRYWRQQWLYTPANMGSFRTGMNDTADGYVANTQYLAIDVNGDGLTDIVEMWHQGSYWAQHNWLNTGGGAPDLLTTINYESGGTTTITYTPSSAWSNTNNPPLMQTVSSVTESDGRGWSATRSYSYSGGLFDWSDHKFQGFQTVTTTEPCLSGEASCPYTVETFDQPAHCGSISPLSSSASYDGAGKLYAQSQTDVTYNCAANPYYALATGEWEYTYDPNNINTYKRTYENLSYDTYGNITKTIDYGDYDVTGDETTGLLSFNYNTSAYLVSDHASETTYAGTTTGGTMLAQTLNYYDCDPVTLQNCNNSAAPTKGLLNRADEYLNQQSYSNSTSSYLTTKSLFDSHGNVTDVYDPNNNHTSTSYDTTYGVYATKATNALGQSATVGYDYLCSEETSMTDVNSQTATTTLDALCRPTQVSLPGGSYVKKQYVNFGNPNTQYIETDTPGPSGDLYSRQYFDGRERTYKTTSRGVSADVEIDTTFDARGNTATVTSPYFAGGSSVVSTYNYDALDRVTKVTLPDNNTTQSFYGPNANCNSCSLWSVTSLDPLGHKQTDWHDAHGNRIQHDEYVGGAWSSATYAYDLLHHLTSSTDPSGNVIAYTVDSLDRTLGVNDPDRGLWTYTYDANNNVLTETDALVTPVISYSYDALNRVTAKTTSGDGNTFSWTYDQALSGGYNVGKLTTKTDPYGSQSFAYDNMGRVTQTTRTTDGVSYPFSYTYDISGRLLTESFPDGDSVGTIVYDSAGQLSSVPSILTSIAYDALGRATSLVNANGTTQSWTYDANRLWVTGITTSKGSTNLQALTYGFDADGNRTSVTSSSSNNSDESWTYGYDELHRVTSAVDTSNSAYSQSFTYNAAGNIASNSRVGSYTYPTQGAGSAQPHAVTSAGGNTYAYNANGQMTSRAGTALSWNGDHLMSNDGSNSYYYGGSRELLKLVNGSNTTRYLGDDFEVSPSGTHNKYIMGAVRVGTGSGNTRWIHSDFNSSLQVQSDGTGTESMRKKYYATGDALSTTGTDTQSKGFTGQRQESSGLTYLHERFYDPLLGRFVSPDPITPEQHGNAGLNRYAYAMNDFVNKEDTSGFMFPAGYGRSGATGYAAPRPAPRPAPSRSSSFLSNYARGPGGPVGYSQAYWHIYAPRPKPYLGPAGGNMISHEAKSRGLIHQSSYARGTQNYYAYLDLYGIRGRLGRKGRFCCYHPNHHTVTRIIHRQRVSSPPPAHHCGGAFSWITCHWRGAVQAVGYVAGAAALAGFCVGTGGIGCIVAGAIAGGGMSALNDATCGNCHMTPGKFMGDVVLGSALGATAPGVGDGFFSNPAAAYAARLLLRGAVTGARVGVNHMLGHLPGTNYGVGSAAWGFYGAASWGIPAIPVP